LVLHVINAKTFDGFLYFAISRFFNLFDQVIFCFDVSEGLPL